MPGRTCSGFSSPGGTAATVTLPLLPNSMVDIGLIVAPLVGVTKNTLLAGGLAGVAAGALAVDAGGVSGPPQAAAITVQSPSITAFTIFIAAPFFFASLRFGGSSGLAKFWDYTLLARRRC